MVIQDDYTEHDLVNIEKFENVKEKEKRNENNCDSAHYHTNFKPHFNLSDNTYYYYFNQLVRSIASPSSECRSFASPSLLIHTYTYYSPLPSAARGSTASTLSPARLARPAAAISVGPSVGGPFSFYLKKMASFDFDELEQLEAAAAIATASETQPPQDAPQPEEEEPPQQPQEKDKPEEEETPQQTAQPQNETSQQEDASSLPLAMQEQEQEQKQEEQEQAYKQEEQEQDDKTQEQEQEDKTHEQEEK